MFYKISALVLLSVFSSFLYASQIIITPKGYSLEAQLSNTSILLGETVQLKLIYRYKDVEDYEVVEPEFSDFIVKEVDSNDYKDSDGYSVEEIRYSLLAQKEGNFSLSNLHVETQIIDANYKSFDNRSKYTKIFSVKANTITLEVIKLPNNISAIGNYRLAATVDKRHVKSGELVTLSISLYGDGNIQNLDAIEPNIKDATSYLIYTTKSKRLHLQTKVYEIISDTPFIIPSFELHYFDKKEKLVKKSSTGLIKVSIDDYVQKRTQGLNNYDKYIFFFLGAISILVLLSLYKVLRRKKIKKRLPFISLLKSSPKRSDLYKIIVVYLGRDKELDCLIYQLEGETKLNFKTIKKEIIKELVKLGLHERDNLFFTTKDTL